MTNNMYRDCESVSEVLLSLIFVLLCLVTGFFLYMYVMVQMWTLFIVPITGLPNISMVQCMGLCLVIRSIFVRSTIDPFDTITKDKSLSWCHAYIFGKSILNPLFVWLVGTIIASFL